MAIPIYTTQTAPIVATAGLTQNINVASPSTLDITGTPNGSAGSAPTGTTTATGTTLDLSQWPIYILILALAYFGFKFLS